MKAKTTTPYPPPALSTPQFAQTDFAEVVYAFIEKFIHEHGYSPSMREIGFGCHIGRSTVLRYLDRLEAQGRISRELGTARSISLQKPQPE